MRRKHNYNYPELNDMIQENLLYSLSDFEINVGVGKNTIYRVFKKYPDTYQAWKLQEPKRRSKKMRGNKNGVHPPTKLVPKEGFVLDVQRGMRKSELMKKYNLSEYSCNRNIEYYGVVEDYNGNKQLPHRCIEDFELLEKLEVFSKGIRDALTSSDPELSIRNTKKVREAHRNIIMASWYLRKLGVGMVNKYGIKGMSFSSNRGEMIVEQILEDLNLEYLRNYPIYHPDGKYVYDFYIPKLNKIIEVDGDIHRRSTYRLSDIQKKDIKRKELAESKGYSFRAVLFKSLKGLHNFDKEVSDAVFK